MRCFRSARSSFTPAIPTWSPAIRRRSTVRPHWAHRRCRSRTWINGWSTAARFYPAADFADWTLIQAGQRAQVVKPHPRRIGELTFGTELVTAADGSIAGLLGASPGASTAPAIMADLLSRCFPGRYAGWEPALRELMPTLPPSNVEA